MINEKLFGPALYKLVRDYIFDDCETVEEEYHKHSECLVVVVSHMNLSSATGLVKEIEDKGVEIPQVLVGHIKPESFVGDWMASTSRTYNDGLDTDAIDFFGRAGQVTETISVTSWKYL